MSQADDRGERELHLIGTTDFAGEAVYEHNGEAESAGTVEASRSPRPEVAKARILPVAVVGFCSVLNLHAPQPILPVLSEGFSVSPTQTALVISSTVFAMMVAAPFAGMLSDLYGRRPVIVAAIFGITLPTLAAAFAPNLAVLLVCRFLQGLFIPAVIASVPAYVAEEWDALQRGRVIGYYVTASVLAGFGGRFIAGLATELGGWRASFVVLGLANLAGAFLVWRMMEPSRNFTASGPVHNPIAAFAGHFKNKPLVAVCCAGFAMMFSFVSLFTYGTFYLSGPPFSLRPAILGAIFVTYLLAVTTTPMAGRLIDRFGPKSVFIAATLIAAAGIFMTVSQLLLLVLLGLVLCSAGVFSSQSACMISTVRVAPSGRSSATGFYLTFYYAGGAIGAVVVGLAYESWGWSGSVLLMVLVQLSAAVIAASMWRGKD